MGCGFFSHSSLPTLAPALVVSTTAFLPCPNLPCADPASTHPEPAFLLHQSMFLPDRVFLPHQNLFYMDPAFLPHPNLASFPHPELILAIPASRHPNLFCTNLAYSHQNLVILPHPSWASPHPRFSHLDLASPLPNLFHADSAYHHQNLAFLPHQKGESRMTATSITHPLKVHTDN